MSELQQFTYSPDIFFKPTLEEAKSIILTPITTATTEERWQFETEAMTNLISRMVGPITSETVILDYGCGIGRIAKALIQRYDCFVVGVDLTASMRKFAMEYVESQKFMACSPWMLHRLNIQADHALAIWVLLHCWIPIEDITLIRRVLKPSGSLFVVNEWTRVVPTIDNTCVDDCIDVQKLLKENFKYLDGGTANDFGYFTNKTFIDQTYWALYGGKK